MLSLSLKTATFKSRWYLSNNIMNYTSEKRKAVAAEMQTFITLKIYRILMHSPG